MIIDCDQCQVRDLECDDCVVSVLLGHPRARTPVELDVAEAQALGALAGAGMVPPLRLVPTGAAAACRRGGHQNGHRPPSRDRVDGRSAGGAGQDAPGPPPRPATYHDGRGGASRTG